MSSYYRRVKFEYYQVWVMKNEEEKLFDLKEWLLKASNVSLEKRAKEYKGERARLEEGYFDPELEYYFLHFVRLRATNIPSKAKLDSNVEPFELEEDEYLGEEVSALYDENKHILMLQRNKFSLGPKGIEEYLNLIWNKENEYIFLKSVAVPDAIKKAKDSKVYRRINLRFANLNTIHERSVLDKLKSPLKKFIDSFGEYDGVNAQIYITVGNKKDAELDEQLVDQTLDDIAENRELFTKAEVAIRDSDDAPVEVIDLFDGKAHDYATFRIEKKSTLSHYALTEAMWELYHPKNMNRQSEVKSYLRPR